MTCSRLFVLGALLTTAAPAMAQPAAGTAPPAAASSKGPAKKAIAKPKTPAPPVLTATPGAIAYPAGLSAAKIRLVRHQVELSGPERRAAKKNDLVLPGQKISTQSQSSAEVNFADGTRVLIGENSELSLYGVAPTPPAPPKKAKPIKPGNTTLLRGEVVLMVPPSVVVAAAPPPPVKGKVKAAKKPPPPKPAATALVATSAGLVTATPGTQVRIVIDLTGVTRVAVYSGQATLISTRKGAKPILLNAGFGSSIENAKLGPKPPQQLLPPPQYSGVRQFAFSSGEAVEIPGTYRLDNATATSWRVQIARDAAFDHLISDIRVASSETRLLPQRMAPGDYHVRVSALGSDGTEGMLSAPMRIRVARVILVPGTENRRASVAVEGKDLHCSLDGAPLQPLVEPLFLTPARSHLLRCASVATNPRLEEIAEQTISAAQSGPLLARIEPGAVSFTAADAKNQISATGQRQVTLVLSDASGNPLSGAAVKVQGQGGVTISPAVESPTAGSYVATATWPAGQTGHSLRYTINDTETYEGRLPDALPTIDTAAQKPAETSAPSDSTSASAEETPPSTKRFALELGVFPSAGIDITRQVFAVGAGLEIGGRIRLPYGGLALALRPQYEFYPPSPSVAHVISVGVPITYRVRKNLAADIVPYFGVLPQFVADYSFLARDGVQANDGQWRTSFAIGGLIGSEFHVKYGAIFVEGGYRQVLLRSAPDFLPTLSGIYVNLGFRASF